MSSMRFSMKIAKKCVPLTQNNAELVIMKVLTVILATLVSVATMQSQTELTLADGTTAKVAQAWTLSASDGEGIESLPIAVTPDGLFALSSRSGANGVVVGYNLADGTPLEPFRIACDGPLTGMPQIGADDAGAMWGALFTQWQLRIGAVPEQGAVRELLEPATVDPGLIMPDAYRNLTHRWSGNVTVSGSIADGDATVAWLECVATMPDGDQSLRLWRAYNCFKPGAEIDIRYSDLYIPDEYPYVSVEPDRNTQVVLTSLTTSLSDNTADVPYFYTSRGASQQAKQRLAGAFAPKSDMCGIHVMQWKGSTWLLYASDKCAVTLAHMADATAGFEEGNLTYAATLRIPDFTGDTPLDEKLLAIGSALIADDRMVCVHAAGQPPVAFRLTADNGGVTGVEDDADNAFTLAGRTLSATVATAVYSADGKRVGEVSDGQALTLAPGVYVIRVAGRAHKVVVR